MGSWVLERRVDPSEADLKSLREAAVGGQQAERRPRLLSPSLHLFDLRVQPSYTSTSLGMPKPRQVAVCICISTSSLADEPSFLLVSSRKHAARWVFPKGGIEEDESASQVRPLLKRMGFATLMQRFLGG